MSLFSSIGNAFKAVGQGIQGGLEGAARLAGSAVKLDFKGMADAVTKIGGGVLDVAHGAGNLTPAAIATNTLLDGAYAKATGFAKDKVLQVGDGVVQQMAGDLSAVKDGTLQAARGLVTGDPAAVLQGTLGAGMGAVATVGNFTPEGLAANAAMSATNVATQTLAGG